MLSMAKEARRSQRFCQEALQGWLVIMSFSPGMSSNKCKVSTKRGKNNDATVRDGNRYMPVSLKTQNTEYICPARKLRQ